MNSLKNQKNHRYQPGNMKITSDLTNLTTAILILTVQMFFEWTLTLLLKSAMLKWTKTEKLLKSGSRRASNFESQSH
jgi:hypothetical protein